LIGAIAYTPRPWILESRASTSGDIASDGFFARSGLRALRAAFFCDVRVDLLDERDLSRD
jgi:hypothetical protein